jgi:hypothetical protein
MPSLNRSRQIMLQVCPHTLNVGILEFVDAAG